MSHQKTAKYTPTKQQKESVEVIVNIFWMMVAFSAFWLVMYATLLKDFKDNNVTSEVIDTCPEAKSELRHTLDQRDAVGGQQPITTEGMEEWKELRDRGVKLKELAIQLCPAGEPLI